MIEQIVLEYLSEQISVPVLMELPEVPSESFPSMPERFLVLEKVGGNEADHIGELLLPFSLILLIRSTKPHSLMQICVKQCVGLLNVRK